MSINQLILRNLKKNLQTYYLYVFALIFSSALYFAFVTLQYDPSMDATKGTIKGAAAIKAASILLVAIISIFLLYANNLFIKRRSRELGLFQLIGMTKGMILRILGAENFILYFASLLMGIFIGFSFSKLILMILFKITGVEAIANLRFSPQALVQTVAVFCAIYLFIMLMNAFFIKRNSILNLFRMKSSTEDEKKVSIFGMIIGILGIIMIAVGYYVSSKLFGGDFTTTNAIFGAMVFILSSVIIGTYLFYKGSVRFIFHLIRKQKNGFLTVSEVLSLSSIMFRMKSNALLLTIITTVSALAIGLLSLSYISYYSAEQSAKKYVAADFAFTNVEDANEFKAQLNASNIDYYETKIDVIQMAADLSGISDGNYKEMMDVHQTTLSVISDEDVREINLSGKDTLLSGYSDMLQKLMQLTDSGSLSLNGENSTFSLNYLGLHPKSFISGYFTSGGLPVAIVDESVFEELKQDAVPKLQRESSIFIGLNIKDRTKLEAADSLFSGLTFNDNTPNNSRLKESNHQKQNMGLVMFIVGFLGLTFLVTSGCILYFKQMDEGEEEKPNYTILRKLGFTQSDLLKGIQAKQLFNFGIPLLIGLLHSYFAVQSGWFFFGTELWVPMMVVMALYTALYSIFGILSVQYYKKVVKNAL